MKSRFSSYVNGVLHICNAKEKSSGFAAVKNKIAVDDLEIIEKLAYGEMSKRNEDIEFAESRGKKLSLKVKTRLRDYVTTNHYVVINKVLYNLWQIDYSTEKQEMYFYLEEERKLL